MEPTALAIQAANILGPALPYLLGVLTSAGTSLGEKIGEEAATRASQLWDYLLPNAEQTPALMEAAHDVANAPSDEDSLASLRLQLRKLFVTEPTLIQALSKVLGTSHTESATASGNGSIAITGGASQSTVSTHVAN